MYLSTTRIYIIFIFILVVHFYNTAKYYQTVVKLDDNLKKMSIYTIIIRNIIG